MRILHVVTYFGKGGLENGLVNVINGLDRGAYQHVVCAIRALGSNTRRLPSDVEVVSLDLGPTSRVQTPALCRMIRRFAPDVVHSRNWGAIEGVFAARWAGAASIHSEHGFEARDGSNESFRRQVVRRVAFEVADAVQTVSGQLRDYVARRTGFSPGRIQVIRNGVDATRFHPDAAIRGETRKRLGLCDDEVCLGCVANLLPVKDHVTLLRALAATPMQGVPWRLLLIGTGSEEAALRRFADAHFAAGRVTFLGASDDVPQLMRAMDVFVLPSVAEGICNSLLEAMATGTPVVATAVGGTPEVIEDGRSGILVRPEDPQGLSEQLAALCADSNRRGELGAGAIRRVREAFSMESMIRGYQRLYEGVRLTADAAPVPAGSR
jgi:sugar transferase (PEP-CTERM/EpsH1 system associated)